jgi:hypothetical protein
VRNISVRVANYFLFIFMHPRNFGSDFLSKVKKFESDLAIFENLSIFAILGGEIVEMRSEFPDFWEKKRRECDHNRRNSPGRCVF